MTAAVSGAWIFLRDFRELGLDHIRIGRLRNVNGGQESSGSLCRHGARRGPPEHPIEPVAHLFELTKWIPAHGVHDDLHRLLWLAATLNAPAGHRFSTRESRGDESDSGPARAFRQRP
jgi:hypothetical protein